MLTSHSYIWYDMIWYDRSFTFIFTVDSKWAEKSMLNLLYIWGYFYSFFGVSFIWCTQIWGWILMMVEKERKKWWFIWLKPVVKGLTTPMKTSQSTKTSIKHKQVFILSFIDNTATLNEVYQRMMMKMNEKMIGSKIFWIKII